MTHYFKNKTAFDVFCKLTKHPTHKRNLNEGDIALIEETNEALIYTNKQWNPFTVNSKGVDLSLFEYNRQLMAQLPEMTQEQLENAQKVIEDYCINSKNTYYMLLSNEIKYYTIFTNAISNDCQNIEFNTIAEAVIQCCKEIGTIKSIDLNSETNAIEIWITDQNNTNFYAFFPYDLGIIKVRSIV